MNKIKYYISFIRFAKFYIDFYGNWNEFKVGSDYYDGYIGYLHLSKFRIAYHY